MTLRKAQNFVMVYFVLRDSGIERFVELVHHNVAVAGYLRIFLRQMFVISTRSKRGACSLNPRSRG